MESKAVTRAAVVIDLVQATVRGVASFPLAARLRGGPAADMLVNSIA